MIKNRLGEKHTTNEGYEVEIISWTNTRRCSISFKCGLIIKDLQYGCVKDGRIKYPFHASVFGVGYFGIGKYFQKRQGKVQHGYNCWKNMLERCYKRDIDKNPTYKDVTVDEEWYNYQVFAKWFEENYVEGWQLDKDILKKGNKTYSPETCCFVPPEINSLIINCKSVRGTLPIGVIKHHKKFRARISRNGKYEHLGLYNTPEEAFQAYKKAKEDYIKEVANKWKDLIGDRVYKSIYNWIIEIED